MVWLNAFIVALVAWIGFHFGGGISLGDQWSYIEALRTTTSIVFGVMGALLAVIFPEVLKGSLRGMASGKGASNLHRLLNPCAHSATLLIVLVTIAPGFAWLRSLNLHPKSDELILIQQVSFSVFCALSYWQVSILLIVLFPMDGLLSSTSATLTRERLRRSIHTNGRG